jgi:hypothetical protein
LSLLIARRRATGLEKILSLSRDKNVIVRVKTPKQKFIEEVTFAIRKLTF